jgi:hypothetical protein
LEHDLNEIARRFQGILKKDRIAKFDYRKEEEQARQGGEDTGSRLI